MSISPSSSSLNSHDSHLTNNTSNTSIESNSNYFNNSMLNYLEPNPVLPPDYQSLPPGGCPKFPIYNNNNFSTNNELPNYSPSIYKIGFVYKKLEWFNPYEPSTTRSWKNVIIELNSTQLNFYQIPNNLESHLISFQTINSLNNGGKDFKNYQSLFTNHYDYQFYKYCNKLNLLNSKKLLRSYSLQYCKIGLASDYKKRPNVLRIRIENEQLLLHFNNTNDLINWNLSINIGKDLLLDLNFRELPKYRTVPRRRRRRFTEDHHDHINNSINNGNNNNSTGGGGGRLRSYSDPITLLTKFSKLKLKLKRDSVPDLRSVIIEDDEDIDIDSFNQSSNSSTFEVPQSLSQLILSQSVSQSPLQSPLQSLTLSLILSLIQSLIPSPLQLQTQLGANDDDEEDVDNLSEISEDEDEDPEITKLKTITSKWNPYIKPTTQRRYYKNCLRCIKPLNSDDSWVSKNLVKPTMICPDLKFKLDNGVKTHFVKEFIVGSHGLIPRDQVG